MLILLFYINIACLFTKTFFILESYKYYEYQQALCHAQVIAAQPLLNFSIIASKYILIIPLPVFPFILLAVMMIEGVIIIKFSKMFHFVNSIKDLIN